MALNLDGMTQDEIDAAYAQQNASAKTFGENLKDPAFYQAYQDSVDTRWNDIQNHTNGYESTGDGGFLGLLGKVMEPIMNTVIKYGPAVYAAAATGDAMGLFGGGATAGAVGGDAAAAGLGDLGAGALSNAGLGLENLGFLDSMTAGGLGSTAAAGAGAIGASAMGGADAGATGLGGMVGVQGGAPAVVSIGAPAATSGGLGTLGAVGAGTAGLAGLSNILGNNPTLPIDGGALQAAPPVESGDVPLPSSDLPPLIIPPLATDPALAAVDPVADGAANIPAGTNGGGIPGLGSLPGSVPSWLQNLIGAGTGLIGGNVDRIKADQDADWWKSQLDTLQGMYKPGTPEATMMEDKMRAQDAAAGRNSQYGIRAQNLAAMLADKRAGIMTSPGYQNMANAYRGRSSQDLNGLFTALGGATGASGGSGLAGLLGAGLSGLSGLFGGGTPAPVR